VVILCDGVHDDSSGSHHHAVTSGTISDVSAAGGSSGTFCAGPPLAPGKPYNWPPAADVRASALIDFTSCDSSSGYQLQGTTTANKCYTFSSDVFKVQVDGVLDGDVAVEGVYDCSGGGYALANPNAGDNNGFTGTFDCSRFEGVGPDNFSGSFAGIPVNNCCPVLFAGRVTHSGESLPSPYHALYCQGQITPTGFSDTNHATAGNFSGDCQVGTG
jgi:hypothetical protein